MMWVDQQDVVALADQHPTGKTFRYPAGVTSSRRIAGTELVPVEDGLFCSINHWTLLRPEVDRVVIRDCLGLQFVQKGAVRQSLDERARYMQSGARVSVTAFPGEVRQVRQFQAGAEVKYVGAWVRPTLLSQKYGLRTAGLPQPLRSFFDGAATSPFCLNLPLSPRMWLTLDDIFLSPLSGALRDVYLRAKLTELICEAIGALDQLGRAGKAATRSTIASRESLQVEAAAQIYRRELHAPPAVETLARRVGLNRNKLTAGFRRQFGCTPHEFATRLRMDWARQLMSNGDMTLAEVARAVGYGARSTFRRAFTERFGVPPAISPMGPSAPAAKRRRPPPEDRLDEASPNHARQVEDREIMPQASATRS